MENTASAKWKRKYKEKLLPETYIELTYAVTEPGLQFDATATATVEEEFSEAEKLVSLLSRSPEKYNTLEWNSWGLDGSFEYFDETPVDPGYVTSTFSETDSDFEAHPTITLTFSKVHTEIIPGVTIAWSEVYNEWASRFRVTAYNGNTVVAEKTVEDNTDTVSVVWFDIQNYNRITIEILAWSHPEHRSRVLSVYMGIKNIFTKDDFLKYSHSQSVDLLSAALPKNEISFSLRNDDDRWNPHNPTGVERYLLERQEITVRYGLNVDGVKEWIDGGRFFLSSWSTPANGMEASFSARDSIEFMSEVYTGTTAGTLYDIAQAVFTQADLPILENGNVRYYIDEDLKNYSTNFSSENKEYTLAEVLQLVAHMGGCVLYQQRDGVMYLGPRVGITSDYVIDESISYAHPEFEVSKPLKAVSCDYGEDGNVVVTVGVSGEVQTISNEFVLTEKDARRIANFTANMLKGRKTVSGEYRADPRLDVLDHVMVHSKYSQNNVVITDITYSTSGGAMRGAYVARLVS